MNNPLKIFHNLLIKGNALDPKSIVETSREALSIYDEDITYRIKEEVGVALLHIDNKYWKNDKTENDYYLLRLISTLDKLVGIANGMLEKQLEQIVTRIDLENWLIVYNNTQAVYEGLITIRNQIILCYSIDIHKDIDVTEQQIRFPYLNEYFAVKLQKDSIANVGVKNTFLDCINPAIEVNTEAMNPIIVGLKTEKISMIHSANISVIEQQSDVQNEEELLEYMEYCGTVESLGLLYSLMFEVKLFLSENRKSKIGRILAKTTKLAEKNTKFSDRSITDMFNVNNRQYDDKNLPFIKGKLLNMLQEIQKLEKNNK